MTTIWGKSHDDREVQFKEQVEKIEAKHIEYFKDRTNVYGNKEPDKLYFHFVVSSEVSDTGMRYELKPRESSYLPSFIMDEVIEAFKTSFSEE